MAEGEGRFKPNQGNVVTRERVGDRPGKKSKVLLFNSKNPLKNLLKKIVDLTGSGQTAFPRMGLYELMTLSGTTGKSTNSKSLNLLLIKGMICVLK